MREGEGTLHLPRKLEAWHFVKVEHYHAASPALSVHFHARQTYGNHHACHTCVHGVP